VKGKMKADVRTDVLMLNLCKRATRIPNRLQGLGLCGCSLSGSCPFQYLSHTRNIRISLETQTFGPFSFARCINLIVSSVNEELTLYGDGIFVLPGDLDKIKYSTPRFASGELTYLDLSLPQMCSAAWFIIYSWPRARHHRSSLMSQVVIVDVLPLISASLDMFWATPVRIWRPSAQQIDGSGRPTGQ
jgi:hypothetical protein